MPLCAEGLIQQEVAAGIPADRVVVGGFSQGGHVALKLLLGTKQRLAGCIACSTWLEFAANSTTQQVIQSPFYDACLSSKVLCSIVICFGVMLTAQEASMLIESVSSPRPGAHG